jgi:hypothetical protein
LCKACGELLAQLQFRFCICVDFIDLEALLCCLKLSYCFLSILTKSDRCWTARMSNVTVCVRFRPLSHKERKANADNVCFRKLDSESFVFKVWTLFSLLPLAFLVKCMQWIFMCSLFWDSLLCSCFIHCTRSVYWIGRQLSWVMTMPFWTLTCLSITIHNYLMGTASKSGSRTSVSRMECTPVCCVDAFITINPLPFDLGVTFQSPHVELMLLFLMCWQTLWVRMRGKKMLYSALTRCSMKMRNNLMSTTSWQCPLFQVWAFLFPSRFILQDSQSCFVLLYFSHVWIVW